MTFCAESPVNDQAMALIFVECISPKYQSFCSKCLMTVQPAFLFLVLGTKWGNESPMLMKSRSQLFGMFSLVGSAGTQIHVWFCMEALGPHHWSPLPTLYWPVFVTQSRQHSTNIWKLVHFSSGSPSMGHIPLFVGQRCALHIHPWNASEMLGWSGCHCIYLGIISHDEHPPSRQQPFLRLWQQLLWHFWPWLQTPKWCWVSRRGGRRSYHGVGPTIISNRESEKIGP